MALHTGHLCRIVDHLFDASGSGFGAERPIDGLLAVLARKSHQKLVWDLDLPDNVSGFNNLH